MLLKYTDNMPIVKISVSGEREEEFDAYIDFAASKTIIPSDAAVKLGLRFAEYTPIATGAGVILLPLYVAKVKAFRRTFDIRVGSLNLPKEVGVRALLGRDVLDSFKICLNGKRKEIEVSDP
jgi:hypothetical protein